MVEDCPEFTSFVRSRSPSLMRSAVLLTGDPHRAEDLLQIRRAHCLGSPHNSCRLTSKNLGCLPRFDRGLVHTARPVTEILPVVAWRIAQLSKAVHDPMHLPLRLVFEQVKPEGAAAEQPPGRGGEGYAAAREEGSWHPKAEVSRVASAPESKKGDAAGGCGRHDQHAAKTDCEGELERGRTPSDGGRDPQSTLGHQGAFVGPTRLDH